MSMATEMEMEQLRLQAYKACEDYIAEFHRRLNTMADMNHDRPEIPRRIERRIVKIFTIITFKDDLEKEDSCPS